MNFEPTHKMCTKCGNFELEELIDNVQTMKVVRIETQF